MVPTVRRGRRTSAGPSCALLALAAVFLMSCEPALPADGARRDLSPHDGLETGVSATQSDSLELSLEVPQQVRAGDPVRLTIRVENTSGRTLDLYLRGREIAFDVIVSNVTGDVVWRRLEDELLQAILRIETLQAGATLELSTTWNQRTSAGEPAPPGMYAARGQVLTEADPLNTTDVPFRIVSD
jgi:hypothetical protein